MRFTLAAGLVSLREDALKVLGSHDQDLERGLYETLWTGEEAHGDEAGGDAAPADDRVLRAALIAEAAGLARAGFHIGERLLLAWLAARVPGLGARLDAVPHALEAATRGGLPPVHAQRSGHGFALRGRCRVLVADGAERDAVLLTVSQRGRSLLVSAPLTGPGTRVERARTVQPDRWLLTVDFDRAQIPEDQVWPWEDEEALHALGRVLAAAELVGVMQWTLDACVRRARERHQFGRPIGAFQAVAHTCADMLCTVELCRSMVYAAAGGPGGAGAPAPDRAANARLLLWQESLPVLTDAVQLHGADGLRWSGQLQWQLRRCQVLRRLWGDPADVSDEIIDHLKDRLAAAPLPA